MPRAATARAAAPSLAAADDVAAFAAGFLEAEIRERHIPGAVFVQVRRGEPTRAQGIGLALMEEILTRDGRIVNPTFTDYLLPTALDMPPLDIALIEDPEPDQPYGAKGVGEPPTVVSTAAVVAALRAASGRPLTRVPVRPDDIALG